MNYKKFTATTSWAKSLAAVPGATRLEVYDALFSYVETGVVPELSPAATAAFAFIKTDLDAEADKAIAICEKRRENIMKRWNRSGSEETKK